MTRTRVFSEDEAGWDNPDAVKVLVEKDTKSKSVFVYVVPQKGVDQKRFAVDAIIEGVLWFGYSRVTVKSDNELAIMKLLQEALGALKVNGIDQASEEHPPPYDPQASGAVEAALKQVTARLETLKLCLEQKNRQVNPAQGPDHGGDGCSLCSAHPLSSAWCRRQDAL